MKLNPIGSNQNEVEKPDGTTILYSYSTPVAVIDHEGAAFRTDRFYSRTTLKHINDFFRPIMGAAVRTVTQETIDAFVKGAR